MLKIAKEIGELATSLRKTLIPSFIRFVLMDGVQSTTNFIDLLPPNWFTSGLLLSGTPDRKKIQD